MFIGSAFNVISQGLFVLAIIVFMIPFGVWFVFNWRQVVQNKQVPEKLRKVFYIFLICVVISVVLAGLATLLLLI